MKKVRALIRRRVVRYEQHPFFGFLKDERISPLERLSYLEFATFFVMSFADLNHVVFAESEGSDPLDLIIQKHGQEDGNHWPWFLHDLSLIAQHLDGLGFEGMVKRIWSDDLRETRFFSYKMISMAMRSPPVLKLVMIESLEAMGKVWLDQTVEVARKTVLFKQFLYVGEHHARREQGHAMGSSVAKVDGIGLSESEYSEAQLLIEELFEGMELFNMELLNKVKGSLSIFAKGQLSDMQAFEGSS